MAGRGGAEHPGKARGGRDWLHDPDEENHLFAPRQMPYLDKKNLLPVCEGEAGARGDHACAKDPIVQVKGREPDSEMFDAKIKLMSVFPKQQVEQNETFPKAKATGSNGRGSHSDWSSVSRRCSRHGTVKAKACHGSGTLRMSATKPRDDKA
jgi:hypothetical protein